MTSGGDIVLPQDPASVCLARRFVREHCDGASEDMCDSAVLLTSEVVTNAFIHGRSEARLRVVASHERVRVEVGDDNARRPRQVVEDPGALDGRGMGIIELVAARWGVTEERVGKTVWFEVEEAS